MKQDTLYAHVAAAFNAYDEASPCVVSDFTCSYGEVCAVARDIASALLGAATHEWNICIFGSRSAEAYLAVFGTVLAGKAFMPVNTHLPVEDILFMMSQSGSRTIILTSECVDLFRRVAPHLAATIVIFHSSECDLSEEFNQHSFIRATPCQRGFDRNVPVEPQSPAYIMFTSGSTGKPKGVMVSQGNVAAYINSNLSCYDFVSSDRFAQTADLSFDLSIISLFVPIAIGASIHVISRQESISPAKFIRSHEVTVWVSVPSAITLMSKLRMLEPGAFPSVRWSLFCGEALQEKSAAQWAQATPNGVIENLYGPTEVTVSVSRFRMPVSSPSFPNGIVPIGTILEGHEKRIIEHDLTQVGAGKTGELCVAGSQVAKGYINNKEETQKRFLRLPDSSAIWYRTGDLVRDSAEGMIFMGRVDDQVQIRGMRVELQEIDGVLRAASGQEMAVALAISSSNDENYDAVYGVVEATEHNKKTEEILNHCRQHLLEYIVPRRIAFIPKMPLSNNGKIDRKKVARWLNSLI